MKLAEWMDKHQQIQLTVFQSILKSEGTVSTKSLAQEMEISLPTLQKEIRSLQLAVEYFEPTSQLIKVDNDILSLRLANTFSIKRFVYSYLEQALDYQIVTFIFEQKEVSITKMVLDLQISEASIFRRLKVINQLLSEFEIQFRNKRLTGEEIQIRSFFFQFFWQSLPLDILEKRTAQPVIGNLIRVIEKHFGLDFSKEQYWKLALWLEIMQNRLDYRGKRQHRLQPETIHEIEMDPFYQELKNILARYLSRFAFQWSEEEAIYLYLFFLSEALIKVDEKWLSQSLFVSNFIEINQQIYRTIVESEVGSESFASFLLKLHVKIAFSKGWIEAGVNDMILLSDSTPEKMSSCMTIIEKELAKDNSDSQWRMLDQAYGLVADIYKRRQQKKLIIGVALEESLQSEEIYQFIQQHLSVLPYVSVKRAKKRDCSLLIASEYTELKQYSYQEVYFFSGQTSLFEANRLKKAVQALLSNN
ncbi:helix-turn-helix domain-containing protein [Enterococcus olivae]